jgi:trk system potassium uptake protein TrkA
MVAREHEVVIIEEDRDKIDVLSEELDCSFLHGDGSTPEILREADPKTTDFLMCLSNDDQANIVGCLVGRSLGFDRVIPRIRNPQFEAICQELGLESYILPERTIARYLADLTDGIDLLGLSTMLKGEARLFAWHLAAENAGPAAELELPVAARAVCYFRDDEFHLIDADTKLAEGDEVVVLTHSRHMKELEERWSGNSSRK